MISTIQRISLPKPKAIELSLPAYLSIRQVITSLTPHQAHHIHNAEAGRPWCFRSTLTIQAVQLHRTRDSTSSFQAISRMSTTAKIPSERSHPRSRCLQTYAQTPQRRRLPSSCCMEIQECWDDYLHDRCVRYEIHSYHRSRECQGNAGNSVS